MHIEIKKILIKENVLNARDTFFPYNHHVNYMMKKNNCSENDVYEYMEKTVRIKYGKLAYEAHILLGALGGLAFEHPLGVIDCMNVEDYKKIFNKCCKIIQKEFKITNINLAFLIKQK